MGCLVQLFCFFVAWGTQAARPSGDPSHGVTILPLLHVMILGITRSFTLVVGVLTVDVSVPQSLNRLFLVGIVGAVHMALWTQSVMASLA